MKKPVRILIAERVASDIDLAISVIRKSLKNCEFQRIEPGGDFLKALEAFRPDVILADYSFLELNGIQPLRLARKHSPHIPFIVWTDSPNAQLAVDCLKAGASDYILKESPDRLGPAIKRALRETAVLAARRLADENFQNIFANSLDGIFRSTAGGRYLNVNAAMAKLYGYDSPRDMINSVTDIARQIYVDPQERANFMRLLETQGMLENYEQRNYRKDGSVIWTSTSVRAVRGPAGELLYYEGCIRDITERKRMEEKLRESEEKYRTLVEHLPAITYISEPDRYMGVSYISPQIQSLGFSQEEWLADPELWFRQIHPDDQQRVLSELEQFQAGAKSFSVEYRLRLPDGQIKWFHDESSYVKNRAGRPLLKQGFMLDVTERKQTEQTLQQAEAKYRVLVEQIPAAVYLWELGDGGRCHYISPHIETMLGFSVEEWLTDPGLFFRQVHPDDRARAIAAEEQSRASGERLHSEFRMLTRDGRLIWVYDESVPLPDNAGQPKLNQGILMDITERKQTEERIKDLLAFNEKILNHSSVGILTYKLTGECVFANENVAAIVGTQIEQLKHQNFHQIASWKNSGLYDLVQKAIITQAPVAADIHHQSTFGKDVWLTVHCVTFQLKEEGHVLLSLTDITERKQAEEALRESENRLILALSGAQMSVWEWDFQTNRISWSPEFFEITGIEQINLETFESFTNLIHADDVARVMAAAEKAMTNKTLFAEEFRIVRSDGEIRWLSNLGHAEYDQMASRLRLIGTVQDVTPRKQAEIERQALLEIMQGLANTKDLQELLKLIHHLIAQVIYAENFFVALYQPESGLFEEIYSVDQYDPPAPPAKLEKSITSYVFRSGEPLLLTRAKFEELRAQGEVALIGTNSASWLGVPLKTSDRMIGVIAVQDYENTNRYSEHDKDFLASIAAQIALVIERKRGEEALRESEEHYRAIFEGVQDAIFVESLDGKVLMVNQRACEMFGYSQAEFLTKTVYDLVPEGHEILMAGGLDSTLSIEPRETVNQRANGETFPIEISGRLQIINSETVLLVVVRDITERKQADEALRESEDKAKALLNALPDLMFRLDRQCTILDYKADRAELYAQSVPTLVNRNIREIGPAEFADLIEFYTRQTLESQEMQIFEYQLPIPGKGLHDYEARMVTSGKDEVTAIVRDITERKEAEKELRRSHSLLYATLESTADGILVMEPNGHISNFNRKFLELWRIPENLAAQKDDQVLLQLVLNQLKDPSAFLSGVDVLYPSLESTSFDELEFWDGRVYERFSQPQKLDGAIIGRVWSFRDITERKQAEVELRASEERFRQLADNIQEVFWMTDAETNQGIYVSPAAEAIWQRPTEYLLHEPNAFIKSVFPEDQPAVLRALEKERNGEKVEIEYRIVRPGGAIRWLWDRAFPIFDDAGRVTRLAGITADITERRESEIALIKSQSRYRELFDNSPVSIWEEDYSLVKKRLDALQQNGIADLKEYFSSHPEEVAQLASLVNVTDANKAALKLYQIEQKEVLLKGLTQILSQDALSHFHEELLGVLSPLKKFVWEGTDRMLNGTQIEVLVNGSIPDGYAEDWSKVIVSVSDITERKRAEEEMRRRAKETSALLETSLALTNLDLEVTLQTIGNSAKTLFVADGCRIFLMRPDGESLRCVLALQENFSAFSDLKVKVGEGVTGAVAASGQAEIVNEMHKDPRAIDVPGTPENEAEAIMFAPLKQRDQTIGVLSIRRAGADRPFQPTDLELLEAFASMAASAVSNAGLFEETQHRLAELEALYENGLAVGRLLEPREIGNKIIETFARYLRWHHVAIRLKREDSDALELVALNLPNLGPGEFRNAAQHFRTRIHKVGQGLSGWVMQTGVPVRTGNVHKYSQYIDTHAEVQSGLYMPLKIGGRVIGVISVESELPDAFTEQDERLLATLASQAAIAFENARLYEAMQKELIERKRAEEALRVSETHYRELADSITDILFELDQNLNCIHWNKASETLIGLPADAAIGRSMYEIFGQTPEQTRIKHIYEDVLQNQQRRTFETIMAWNGQQRSFEINAYPSTRGVSVVAKDVTDRKRSEIIMQKRFELMEYSAHHTLNELMQRTVDEVSELTSSTIGFFHFVESDQKTLAMQTWSTSALRLFSVPVSAGTHLPLDQAGVWAEAIRQRHPLIQNNYELLPKKRGLPEGHVPIRREIVIPIIRNERIMAVMGIGNKPQDYTRHDLEVATRLADYAWDITERKQMEMALETERNQLAQRVEERTSDLSRANANLARALRVKDEFLANMSHELRTPLNAILGLSESLGEQIAGPLNEKQQKYITTISESGHHLLALINDILDLAKIEAGQITLDINKVDVHSVCQASLRMIKQLAQKKNQEVILQIEDGLGLMWADERRLKQMIVNLLGNAVKFTPENGRIGLEVHGDQEANKITITVWDNGIGIKPEDLARLFQPFVQLDSGLAREATGTGLGLALVAQMARLHGGSVNAFSEPGQGSRFSIILPWEPVLAMDAATRLRITGKFRAIKPNEMNKPVILLVEDTQEVVMMIRDYLELAGYKLVTAQDGLDALVQAKLTHPNLILMDVQMPRMDGLEATRRLRSEAEFRYTPIIALTALAMPHDRERCLEAGMDEYISKPINLKALVKIIQSCLFDHTEPASR